MGGGDPQVAAVSIVSGDGRLIATSRAYPAPDVSIATRDDFVGIRDDKMFENVSRVMVGKLANETVFNTAVPRKTPDGRFAGIVTIALRPSYFGAFYRELLGEHSTVSLGLTRTDGAVLAWYPTRPPDRMELAASSPLREAYASGQRNGVVRMRS